MGLEMTRWSENREMVRKSSKMGKSDENGKGALNDRKSTKMAKSGENGKIGRKWQNRRNRGNNKI